MCLLPERYIWVAVRFEYFKKWFCYMDLINLSEAEKNIYLQWHFYLVWFFEFFTTVCPPTKYGPNCELKCTCKNGGLHSPVDGSCTCALGWTEDYCEKGKLITTFFYSIKSTAYCHSLIKYSRNLWRGYFPIHLCKLFIVYDYISNKK